MARGDSHLYRREFPEAVELAAQSAQQNRMHAPSFLSLSSALARLGRVSESSAAMGRLLELRPMTRDVAAPASTASRGGLRSTCCEGHALPVCPNDRAAPPCRHRVSRRRGLLTADGPRRGRHPGSVEGRATGSGRRAIARHGGRIVKTTGDGLLVEFASPVEATRTALEVQDAVARTADAPGDVRLELRSAIHMGDVTVEGTDLLGDGINVAARLQASRGPRRERRGSRKPASQPHLCLVDLLVWVEWGASCQRSAAGKSTTRRCRARSSGTRRSRSAIQLSGHGPLGWRRRRWAEADRRGLSGEGRGRP